MFTFKINEIPEGKSEEIVRFENGDLDLSPYSIKDGVVLVHFEKYTSQIRLRFKVTSKILLLCDRSLEHFYYPIQAEYTVLFDAGAKETIEDEQTTVKPLVISSNQISIETEVRDTILLQVPIRKLHPRFIDENGEEIDFEYETESDTVEESQAIDPRWEKLKNLQ